MNKITYKMFEKALLMAVLTGAAIGVSHAGYDADDSQAGNSLSRNESSETRRMHAQMLILTLSEEYTEVEELASQQMKFREMGDAEGTQIARMYGRWIRDHKAGVPALARLIRAHGGNPEDAKELKAPALGNKHEMLMATHKAHEAAVMTSQMRFAATNDWDIKRLMKKRANVARKHLAQMKPYHEID